MQERQIKCPHCGRLTVYNPKTEFRPFCSERCKLIDLGAWADESYKVPTPQNPENSIQELNSDEFNTGEEE
ncbi:MAG: DNA gyrase inhibitor YacG [Bdellovibrionota bacterium]